MDFRVRECAAYWSHYSISFPYGTLCVFHEDDDIPCLKHANLERSSFETIVNNTQNVCAKMGAPVAFYVTEAWGENVQDFEKYLSEKEYQLSTESDWLRWNNGTDLSVIGCDFDIRPVSGLGVACHVLTECFGLGKIFLDFAGENMSKYDGDDLDVQFFGAYDNEKIIGIVGVTLDVDNGLAHVHCLCVSEMYRAKNIAKSLMVRATKHAALLGIDDIFVIVHSENKASIAVQKACGYSHYETARVWKK